MPGGKGILVAVRILLQVRAMAHLNDAPFRLIPQSAQGLRDRLAAITDLLCQFEKCLCCLQIRCNVRYEGHTRDTLVDIGVHLFHVLALTQHIVKREDETWMKQGQLYFLSWYPVLKNETAKRKVFNYKETLLGDKDIKNAVACLEDLTSEQLHITTMENLECTVDVRAKVDAGM